MRRSASLILAALLVVPLLSGCETTADKSAKLKAKGAKAAKLTTVDAGAANTAVKVASTTLLRSADGSQTAAVVELDNTGAAQAQVPVLIDVQGTGGKSVYKNDLDGLQIALQQMSYLPAKGAAYWVNDQVIATSAPKKVDVQVGKGKPGTDAAPPKIRLDGTRLVGDSSGVAIEGTVHLLSKTVQRNLPVYGVVRKGAKVVAAGRAIIERLDPDPTPKPTPFRIFLVGDPKGGRLDVRAYPTALGGAQ